MKWRHPNTITGSTAEGQKYFRRYNIEEDLWREIEKGNHILFVAPRRVGKSSIMKYLSKHSRKYYTCTYQNIASDATAEELYKRMLSLILIELNALEKSKEKLVQWFEKKTIEEIKETGVKFGSKKIDYKAHLFKVIGLLKREEVKIVLFLDEFPDVIKNISEKEGPKAAQEVLHTLRSLRHNDDFRKYFVLVLAGSIGLDHIVKKIDRLSVINDLHEQYLPPLSVEDAHLFIVNLVDKATMQITEEARQHIQDRLGALIPYFIQLIVEECDKILQRENRPLLEKTDIDAAYDQILSQAKYFSDWDDRLKNYFDNEYPFFVDILTLAAHNGSISIQEAYDIATKHNLTIIYKGRIDDVLVKDGYLHQVSQQYYFNSPFLRDWWVNRHPLINK